MVTVSMKSTLKTALVALMMVFTGTASALAQGASDGWRSHDMSRPKPPRITPPPQNLPVPPPEGAVILFDGSDLSGWERDGGGGPAEWTLGDGYFEVAPGTGAIQSREAFGDVHLHVEWASPNPPEGDGQDRGNSGVFLMNRYEIQVLDSYSTDTYADGQAGAIYGQYPPRFNATLPPGEWQSYDIFFRRPRFDDGELVQPARMTVVHNGILIQDNEELFGPTSWLKHLEYEPHGDQEPIQLQDHGHRVRFRNIWALPLPELAPPGADYLEGVGAVDPSDLDLEVYAGTYDRPGQNAPVTVTVEGGNIFADFFWRPGPLELLPEAEDAFQLKDTDGRVTFARDEDGRPVELVFHLGGAEMPARRR